MNFCLIYFFSNILRMSGAANSSSSISVLILKAPSEDTTKEDVYVEKLRETNFSATFIPTLQFRFKNLDVLSQCLNHPERYAGIIFNSPRCVRSVIECLENQPLKEEWRSLKCFVVGQASGKIVENELKLSHEGQDTGNLSALLQEISKYNVEKPFLMPVGNLHKDTSNIFKLEKVEVYETCEHEKLSELLKHAVKYDAINVLVFFSPSGVKSVLPYIPLSSNKKFRFLAIGPTTAEEMKKCYLEVHGICKKPNPESLIELISNFK